MAYKKSFEFILSEPLEYSHDGDLHKAKKLLLNAPSSEQLKLASRVGGVVSNAFLKAQSLFKDVGSKPSKKNTQEDDDGKMSSDMIFMVINSSFDGDEGKQDRFIDAIKELLLSENICLIEGKEPLKIKNLNDLDYREITKLMGEYIGSFLLPFDMSK